MAKDFGLLDSLGEPERKPNAIVPDASVSGTASHQQQVRGYLKAIAWFTGIVAAATVAGVIAQIAPGLAGAARLAGY